MAGLLSKREFLSNVRSMDEYRFERFIADVWDERGYETTVRKGSGDRGIDVVATKGPEKQLIQAKRYSESNKVGSQSIRNYATLYQQVDDVDSVIIITTSSFTEPARELAKDLNVETIDGEDLYRLVDSFAPNIAIKYLHSSTTKEDKNDGEHDNYPNPFNNKSEFDKISSNQGYIDSCTECGSESVWYGVRSYSGKKYHYLNCSDCGAIWANNGTPPSRSLDDWLRVENERDLKGSALREKVNKESSSRPIGSGARPTDGDCFIATAAYGTPHASDIDTLRVFRDQVLSQSVPGNTLITLYYQCSPPIANWVSKKERRRKIVRSLIIAPSVRFSERVLELIGS